MQREDLAGLAGTELGVSDWFTLDQARINAFADVTDDHQYIHLDADRARETPLGGTVAHGFLTLAMLSAMSYQAMPDLKGEILGLNYGFDRIRFVSPVPSGARIRGRFVLADQRDVTSDQLELSLDVTIEIEGQERPAIVARWIHRRYFAD